MQSAIMNRNIQNIERQMSRVQEIAELYKDLEDQGFVITDQNWQTQKHQIQQSALEKKNNLISKQGYKTQEAEEENNQQVQQMQQQQQQYTDRNKYNQGNGDYINLYSSSNNSQQKQNSEEDEDQKQRIQNEEYEETYSVEVDEGEEEQNFKFQNQQNRNVGQGSAQSKSSNSAKNANLSNQLDKIEQEIQRLQLEEQESRNQIKKNDHAKQRIKNTYQRGGVVPEENEEEYHSNSNQKKKKLITKNQQIIYANNDEKKQKGGQKVYKNNQVEKVSTYVPGQRLYEYALEKTRRKEQIKQQIEIERQQKEIEQCTFNPRLISTNRQFDDFHARNERWMRQKEINIDQKLNFEKEKEIRECTFNPEIYTPNRFSSQYTNISNDPAFVYKRQMEWKNRVEAEIFNQKEANDIMIKERSNEIFTSGKMRSTMMNSPQRNSEYEAVGQSSYSSRLNKILYSCKQRNSGNYNEEGQSIEQSSYQQYNQQHQNYGYAYGRNYEQQDFQVSQINQNNQEKVDNLVKSQASNIEGAYDLVNHINGIMRQSNYCDQNIELEQMIAQQNKQQLRSQYGNCSSDKRNVSSSKKDYHKVSQQGPEFQVSKEEIKQKEVDRLREELLQNKPIEITKHPILAERKEYAQVIGNIQVQKNKYVLAWQVDPNMEQPQHYVNFSFDNQQQQNEMLIGKIQNSQFNQQLTEQQNEESEQMITHQHTEITQSEQHNPSVYFVQRQVTYTTTTNNEVERRMQISKTSNDEQEELITHEHQQEMYSLPNNQTENYERAVHETEDSEVL